METSVIIPDTIIEKHLREIERDRVSWSMIVDDIGFDFPEIKDPILLRKAALEVARRLLANVGVITLLERVGEKTEIWDFESDKILSILEKHWDLYKESLRKNGDRHLIFFSRKDIALVGRGHAKPIILLKEPPSDA